jgi:hypothetical protein
LHANIFLVLGIANCGFQEERYKSHFLTRKKIGLLRPLSIAELRQQKDFNFETQIII